MKRFLFLFGFVLLWGIPAQAQNNNPSTVTAVCGTKPSNYPSSGRASLVTDPNGNLCAGVSVSATIATTGLAISVNAGSSSTVGTPIYARDNNGVFEPLQLNGTGLGAPLYVDCDNCSSAAGATTAAPGATVAVTGTTGSEALALNYVYNPGSLKYERMMGASVGDTATSTGLAASVLFGFDGSTFDRLKVESSSNPNLFVGVRNGANQMPAGDAVARRIFVDASGATVNVNFLTANIAVNTAQLNGVALGSPSAYGSSPGAVNVPGVNAFITNTPAVTISGQPVNVNFLTSTINVALAANQSVNVAQLNGLTTATTPFAGGAALVVSFATSTIPVSIGATVNVQFLTANVAFNLAQVNGHTTSECNSNGCQAVGGPGASGSTTVGFPVLVAGATSGNTYSLLTDASGRLVVTPSADTVAGNTASIFATSSGASTNQNVVKASSGNVYSISAINTSTVIYYLRLYNTATTPTCSSATNFIDTLPIPPAVASGGAGGFSIPYPTGRGFSNGIAYCLTGGGGNNDNTNAAAGVYTSFAYK